MALKPVNFQSTSRGRRGALIALLALGLLCLSVRRAGGHEPTGPADVGVAMASETWVPEAATGPASPAVPPWPHGPSRRCPALPPTGATRSASRRGRRRSGKGRTVGAIYCRYSTDFQHSTEDQIRRCKEVAEQKGIEVPDDLVFVDDTSIRYSTH